MKYKNIPMCLTGTETELTNQKPVFTFFFSKLYTKVPLYNRNARAIEKSGVEISNFPWSKLVNKFYYPLQCLGSQI